MDSTERSGEIRCCKCDCTICPPRKREQYQPLTYLICDTCEIENPLARVFHKLNTYMIDEERNAFNDFKNKLWLGAEAFQEVARHHESDFRLKQANQLMELVRKIPTMLK